MLGKIICAWSHPPQALRTCQLLSKWSGGTVHGAGRRLFVCPVFPNVSSTSTKGLVCYFCASLMPYSAQWLECSWAPEKYLFIDYHIVRENSPIVSKVLDFSFLPALSCLMAFLLSAQLIWLKQATEALVKHMDLFFLGEEVRWLLTGNLIFWNIGTIELELE